MKVWAIFKAADVEGYGPFLLHSLAMNKTLAVARLKRCPNSAPRKDDQCNEDREVWNGYEARPFNLEGDAPIITMLMKCQEQFAFYEHSHREKVRKAEFVKENGGAPVSDKYIQDAEAKAKVNADFVREIQSVLTATLEAPSPHRTEVSR